MGIPAAFSTGVAEKQSKHVFNAVDNLLREYQIKPESTLHALLLFTREVISDLSRTTHGHNVCRPSLHSRAVVFARYARQTASPWPGLETKLFLQKLTEVPSCPPRQFGQMLLRWTQVMSCRRRKDWRVHTNLIGVSSCWAWQSF